MILFGPGVYIAIAAKDINARKSNTLSPPMIKLYQYSIST
jgi:hypothetical protein